MSQRNLFQVVLKNSKKIKKRLKKISKIAKKKKKSSTNCVNSNLQTQKLRSKKSIKVTTKKKYIGSKKKSMKQFGAAAPAAAAPAAAAAVVTALTAAAPPAEAPIGVTAEVTSPTAAEVTPAPVVEASAVPAAPDESIIKIDLYDSFDYYNQKIIEEDLENYPKDETDLIDKNINKLGWKFNFEELRPVIDNDYLKGFILSGINGETNKTCQDTVCIKESGLLRDDDKTLFLGIFDGHGTEGEKLANESASILYKLINLLVEKFLPGFDPQQLEEESTLDIFRKCLTYAFVNCDDKLVDHSTSGTTATIIIIFNLKDKFKIFTAYVGDSKAILGHQGNVIDIANDQAHDACHEGIKLNMKALQEESEENEPGIITACEKEFSENYISLNSEEELIDEEDNIKNEFIEPRKPIVIPPTSNLDKSYFGNLEGYALNMTRSLGDHHLKSIGKSCLPNISNFDLDKTSISKESCIILASDGIWEECRQAPEQTITSKKAFEYFKSEEDTCKLLIEEANLNWSTQVIDYRDDISLLVLDLNKYLKSLG